MARAPILSVVDYDAWDKGYMPPSEHRLIHALSYEGARVRASSHVEPGRGWWIITQGDVFDSEDEWEVMMFVTERQLRRVRRNRERFQAVLNSLFGESCEAAPPPPVGERHE